ncbi:MAG TPA: RdgB/HAM1 family non-canonical purine NTP pyrophosphatase [Bacteroidales bacterium]|nr:RdgB/HAM1 family non-canonical purine NTP pyrophosphatase [Bacteroidales bacterium]
MMKLVFATHNEHKLKELRSKLSQLGPDRVHWEIFSLDDIGCTEEIPEPHETLQENAMAKARYVWERYSLPCFADDTGLEIDALDGRPGVYSARYAGEGCSFADNVLKVLKEMKGEHRRSARFRTVIALILEGEGHYFEGQVEGSILEEGRGDGGFGYDPVFMPEGYALSFAEMPLSEKNRISHRARAVEQLIEFLAMVDG